MSEWDARGYSRISALQQAMAAEVLALLELRGDEHILDIGCGSSKTTAEIAARVPKGTVIGVDSSQDMIDFASAHFPRETCPNLEFRVADARRLPFNKEFDLVVSFNALHWIPEQQQALASLRSALKSGGTGQLRFVPAGKRKSLEDVIEETRRSSRWSSYFEDFRRPYLHLTPEQYQALAERSGLRVRRIHTESKEWDFHSRTEFQAFGSVTFTEWLRLLPASEHLVFIGDVLDRYRPVTMDAPSRDNVFKFYQMDIAVVRD